MYVLPVIAASYQQTFYQDARWGRGSNDSCLSGPLSNGEKTNAISFSQNKQANMVPFRGHDRSHCNTAPYGTPSMVQYARVNFWEFLVSQWRFLWEIFMHCFWIGSVFRGAHQRGISLHAADEETPRSRGEAPTATHSLLSEASRVEKQDFDEATASYNSVVWGHFAGVIGVKYCFCVFKSIYLRSTSLRGIRRKYIGIRFGFWRLMQWRGNEKRKKQNRKMTLCQCFLTTVAYANGNTSNMMWWYELALWFETVSFC